MTSTTPGRTPAASARPPLHRAWRAVRRALGRGWLALFRWQIRGGAPPVQKAVVVAYPHTSNWDLLFTLAIAWALDIDIRFLGKQSLFRYPIFGALMRGVGGIPVDRSRRTGLVEAVATSLAPLERALVVISPEGTRSRAGHWKSGFYRIALEARVPIVLGFLDYTQRRGGLGEILHPTGDISHDFEKIKAFYAGVEGRYPDQQGELTLDLG